MSFLLLALLWLLSTHITFAKQLQYKEDHQASRRFYSLGNRGQWTWKSKWNSNGLIILGPLFEDIRGPILSQISGESVDTNGEEIITSNEETEELCPKDEEVSGDNVVITSGTRLDLAPPSSARSTSHSTQPSCIPSTRSRIAATLVDSLTSSTSVYTHGDDGIIAFDGETKELCPKAEEVFRGSVVRTSGMRIDSAPPSSSRSTSRSTQLSPIPSTRSRTVATLAGSLTPSSSVHPHVDDGIIASDYKTEEVYPKAENLEVFGGSIHTHSEAPFNQKLLGKLKMYYTLLEPLRRVVLGTMTGVYKDH